MIINKNFNIIKDTTDCSKSKFTAQYINSKSGKKWFTFDKSKEIKNYFIDYYTIVAQNMFI